MRQDRGNEAATHFRRALAAAPSAVERQHTEGRLVALTNMSRGCSETKFHD